MRSDGRIKLILVADSDLLQDRMWLRKQRFFGREVSEPFASNATFVINAIENLGGSDELVTLRSRGVSRRPLERVDDLRRRAETALREKEQELKEKLKATQERIASLEGVRSKPNPDTGVLEVEVRLSTVERAEVEALRTDMLSVRAELRAVARSLRKDVEALEATVQIANIVLVPLIVAVMAGALGITRAVRRRRRVIDG